VDLKEAFLALISLLGLIPLIMLAIDILAFQFGAINATTLWKRVADTMVDLVTPWWLPLFSLGLIGVFLFIVLLFWLGKDEF